MEGYKTIEVEKETEQKPEPKEDEPSKPQLICMQVPKIIIKPYYIPIQYMMQPIFQ